MSANKEAQEEELEVLKSIYEGDSEFKSVDDHTFQYKFGAEGEKASILIEIKWADDYPEAAPKFNLGAFYNNHLSSSAKSALIVALNEEAEKSIGSQQTYTIIEWARESYVDVITPYLADDLSSGMDNLSMDGELRTDKGQEDIAKTKVRKEQLTKSQKRKEWNRTDATGEKPRGYDWIDVVKHLSQTGSAKDFGDVTGASYTPDNYLPSADLPN